MRDELTRLLASEPDVRLAVLFGSYARGTAGRHSDIDVGLSGPSSDRLNALTVDLERALHRVVHLIAIDEAPPLLRFEISRDGVLLVERESYLWSAFKARAMVDWWDWAPLARRFGAAAARRLRAQGHGQA